jgi:TIR domain/Domain of unknown function (DUF4062)
MKTSLVVFVCSTYSDLTAERSSVLEGIRRLQLRHDSMEFFGARTEAPIEICLEEVRRSDVIVVIVGLRYGSLIPGTDISFSEAEYNEAYRLRKPCLVYILDENVPILPRHFESNPINLERLRSFKERLMDRHTIAYFQGAGDLAVHVVADLSRTIEAIEEVAAEKSRREEISHSELTTAAEVTKIVDDALRNGASPNAILSAIRKAVFSLLKGDGLRPPLVFLSYSHSDQHIAQEFARALAEEGIETWLDIEEIELGDEITERLYDGLQSADVFVFFLSGQSINKVWTRLEMRSAMARRLTEPASVRIIPVLVEDVEVPALLRDVRYLDLRNGDVKSAARMLASTVRALR